jgi:hypothetical protein
MRLERGKRAIESRNRRLREKLDRLGIDYRDPGVFIACLNEFAHPNEPTPIARQVDWRVDRLYKDWELLSFMSSNNGSPVSLETRRLGPQPSIKAKAGTIEVPPAYREAVLQWIQENQVSNALVASQEENKPGEADNKQRSSIAAIQTSYLHYSIPKEGFGALPLGLDRLPTKEVVIVPSLFAVIKPDNITLVLSSARFVGYESSLDFREAINMLLQFLPNGEKWDFMKEKVGRDFDTQYGKLAWLYKVRLDQLTRLVAERIKHSDK